MKNFKVIVVGTLVISLIINVRLFSKVSDMEQRLTSNSFTLSDTMRTVETQAWDLQNMLTAFIDEQRWISSIRMDVINGDFRSRSTKLQFNWQIKELLNDSEVAFHYKFGGDDEYRTFQAVDAGNGRFKATIPVELKLEPSWYHMFSMSRGRNYESTIDETAFEVKTSNLSYYVTVSNGELLKSSEIVSTDIAIWAHSIMG